MKKAAVVFLFLTIAIASRSQTIADVDTFTVNSGQFIAITPVDWFSTLVKDSIQGDTIWNYKMRYAPKQNPKNTYAEIWLRITNNTKDTSTPKQRKEFQKNCVVKPTKLDKWPCYLLNYSPEKVKGCKKCGMLYSQVYSIPLNPTQSLELLFLAQGESSEVYSLQISFGQFAGNFVKTNERVLSTFRVINFNVQMPIDTYMVGFYLLKFPYSRQFSRGYKEQEIGLGGRTMPGSKVPDSHRITSPNGDFVLSVVGEILSPDSAFRLTASDTIISRVISRDPYGYGSCIRLQTKRAITTFDNKTIVFSFEIKLQNQDPVWIAYYENILYDYVNKFIQVNHVINDYHPVNIFAPPSNLPITPYPLKPKHKDNFQLELPKPK